ncbi:hypothetical protein CSZ94_12045 [Janthinobacterium sp. ROICE36]|nr:hypothetical protein CSZ94_12045 [Janthinobacterium sp. ROICE36]
MITITLPISPQPITVSAKPPTCVNQQATTNGTAGSAAGMASAGRDGTITSSCVLHLGHVSGLVQVKFSGGTGGNGGNGANGGNGGNGGIGVAALPDSPCGALAGGSGGNGGNGSDGMNGGKGADGPQVVLYYTAMDPGTTFSMDSSVLSGGLGGSAGGGGQPGSAGRPGASGAQGNLAVRSEAPQ